MTDVETPSTSTKHRIEYALANFLKQRVLNASESVINRYIEFIFILMYYVFRVGRNVVQTNIEIAFPDLSTEEKKQLIRANYWWSARVGIEILRMDQRVGKTDQYVTFRNLSILDEALAEDKGILLISGHFGHWEMIVPALAEKGYDMYIYVGGQSNPLVDNMHNTTRASFGATTIPRGKSIGMQFMRILKKRNVLAMLTDQNDRKSDTFVQFFGKLAAVTRSTAGFHLARKSPIIVSYCAFVGDKTEIVFDRIEYEVTGDKEKDQWAITQKISDAIEAFVRLYPEQYFWLHRRWRTRPPEDSTSVY